MFIHEKFDEKLHKSGIGSGIENGTVDQSKNQSGGFTEKKRSKMLELIHAIEADPHMSQDMLAKKTEVGKRTVARYLNELSDMEIIERVGAAKGGKYIIKSMHSKKEC